MIATRCRRCDDTDLGGPTLCPRCTRLADDVVHAVCSGVRRFWRFDPADSDEPTAFEVEVLDGDRIVADFARGKSYRIGWLRFAAFASREATLRYRLDRIEREERLQTERLVEERRRADEAVRDAEIWLDEAIRDARALDEAFAREHRSRSARRVALVLEMTSATHPLAPL